MEPLTPNDIKRWDLDAIRQVFETANGRSRTMQRFGDDLQQSWLLLEGWKGEAGPAFRDDLGKARRDIEQDGQESRQVATAVQRAELDISGCKASLDDIEERASENGWTITPDWRVDVGNTGIGRDPIEFAAVQQMLQDDLNQLKVRAHAADQELATAIRAAVGDIRLDDQGREVGGQPRDAGSQQRPGATDVNDPGVKWQPGFNPEQWKNSWHNPLLADNPPGYTGGAGPARDAAWQNYLAHFPQDGRGYLPNPDAVNDPGLKMIGNAGTQLGVSYAWGGKGLSGPGKGTLNDDPPDGGAHIYRDDQRTGFDCSGLAEYAAWQTTHTDIGAGTGTQIGSSALVPVSGPLKPGDLIYYGPGGAHHVGIYIAPGVILNAPESGLPVELDHRSTSIGPDSVDGVIRARALP